jgi:hypothetical protein
MTTRKNQTGSDDAGSVTRCAEPRVAKKPYQSPTFRDWGSILELTAGAGFDSNDGDFTGSGAG